MLGIILTILKYVGIIAGILLLIVLALVLLLLFVSIRYDVTGEKQEKASAKGKVQWLFPAVSYRFIYEKGEMKQVLRIFGVPVWKK